MIKSVELTNADNGILLDARQVNTHAKYMINKISINAANPLGTDMVVKLTDLPQGAKVLVDRCFIVKTNASAAATPDLIALQEGNDEPNTDANSVVLSFSTATGATRAKTEPTFVAGFALDATSRQTAIAQTPMYISADSDIIEETRSLGLKFNTAITTLECEIAIALSVA